MFAQFMRKQDFVYDFEDAGPEPSVQAVGRVNDHSRDFILFHRAKLVLLLLACEAKNLSAVVSFRETSATRSQEDFFTLSRKGAKKAFESKTPISSLDLSGFASLREISAKRSREEFFTPRREDAKAALNSKDPTSSLDLSGLASLREISARQGREEFFTLRREGAKKAFKPKSLISSPGLSGFASLREISGFCRQRQRQSGSDRQLQHRKEKGGPLETWQR